MLPDFCIHLISSPTTTAFHFSTAYAGFSVFGSDC